MDVVALRERFPHTPDERDNRCTDCDHMRHARDSWDMGPPCWGKISQVLEGAESELELLKDRANVVVHEWRDVVTAEVDGNGDAVDAAIHDLASILELG